MGNRSVRVQPSHELVSVHIHDGEDVFGQRILIQHGADGAAEFQHGAGAEGEVKAEVAVRFLQRGRGGLAERDARRQHFLEAAVERLDAEFRQRAATILIDTYFRPEEQIALREMMGLPADVVIPESESDETPEQEARSEGRSASFRLDVVPAYNYTCALTGYRHLLYRLLSDRHPFATIVQDRSLCMTCDCPGTIVVTLVDDAAERIRQIK